jgi:hypothetical protein
MKRLTIVATLFFLHLYCVSNNPPTKPPLSTDPSLVLWFPFDDTIGDASLFASGAIVNHGVTLTTDRNDRQNKAAYFSGDSTGIDIPYKPCYYLSEMTLCAWVNFDTFATYQKIIALNHADDKNDSYSLGIYCNSDIASMIEFWIYTDRSYGPSRYFPNILLETNRWHFIAGTYDGDTMRSYVDGVFDRKAYVWIKGIAYNFDKNLFIGHSPTSSSFFKGKIDDLRVYNRALSESEIDSLYKTN